MLWERGQSRSGRCGGVCPQSRVQGTASVTPLEQKDHILLSDTGQERNLEAWGQETE